MISVELAGIPIGIEHKFGFIKTLTSDYITEKPPLFTVSATDDNIEAERRGSEGAFPDSYLESIALFRNIAEQLPLYDAVVFHGAVIACGGKAYAVTARSGVGKTTHLSLWLKEFEDVYILNGDKPIIRNIDGKIYAFGSPWRGKEGFGVNEMLPLAGIAFLERSPNNFAIPLTVGEAVLKFASQMYIPKEKDSAPKALSIANKILASVPLYRLGVNMEPEAARVARAAFIKNNK